MCRGKMEFSLEVPGGLRQEEVEEHRRFLQETGFLDPVTTDQMLAGLGMDDEDDDDGEEPDLPVIEPVE